MVRTQTGPSTYGAPALRVDLVLGFGPSWRVVVSVGLAFGLAGAAGVGLDVCAEQAHAMPRISAATKNVFVFIMRHSLIIARSTRENILPVVAAVPAAG